MDTWEETTTVDRSAEGDHESPGPGWEPYAAYQAKVEDGGGALPLCRSCPLAASHRRVGGPMAPSHSVWVTTHALGRWRQRVSPGARPRDVRAAAREAHQVPEALLPYFRVEEPFGLLWSPTRGVLFLMRGPRVITCWLARPGHRILLERHGGA